MTQPALAVLGFDDFPPKLAAMFEAAVAAPHTFVLLHASHSTSAALTPRLCVPARFQLCVIEEDAVKATLMLFEVRTHVCCSPRPSASHAPRGGAYQRRQRGQPRELLRLSLRRSEAEVIKAYEAELARQRYEQEQRGVGGL